MSKFQVKMYRGSSHSVEKEPGETLHYANAHYERVYAYTIKSLIGLGRDQTRPSDGSELRLSIDSTLTQHFLADSYMILLEESRLGLDFFKTRTGSNSKGLTSDGSK